MTSKCCTGKGCWRDPCGTGLGAAVRRVPLGRAGITPAMGDEGCFRSPLETPTCWHCLNAGRPGKSCFNELSLLGRNKPHAQGAVLSLLLILPGKSQQCPPARHGSAAGRSRVGKGRLRAHPAPSCACQNKQTQGGGGGNPPKTSLTCFACLSQI